MAGEKSVSSLLALLHRDLTFVPVQRSLGGLNVNLGSPKILTCSSYTEFSLQADLSVLCKES